MPYSSEHKAQTRERIVHAARRLFNRHGFEQVSIDRVMSEAGLTRGAFYHHFDSKDELYAAAVASFSTCNPFKPDFKDVLPGQRIERQVLRQIRIDVQVIAIKLRERLGREIGDSQALRELCPTELVPKLCVLAINLRLVRRGRSLGHHGRGADRCE